MYRSVATSFLTIDAERKGRREGEKEGERKNVLTSEGCGRERVSEAGRKTVIGRLLYRVC